MLLVSTALCGAILGGVVASVLVDSVGFDAVSSVLAGIATGGGAGLIVAAAIALRVDVETLRRYSRVTMVLAILFLVMLMIRRYRIEQEMREQEIELVPVKFVADAAIVDDRRVRQKLIAVVHYFSLP